MIKTVCMLEAGDAALSPPPQVDILSLSRNDQRAFWINVYNVLVIHATAVKGWPSSPLQRKSFFSETSYHVSGHDISLDGIEHGVLRGNSPPPALLLPAGRSFTNTDPRRFWALPLDPRIHFALNCGARSCPPIRVYSGENIEEELTAVAEAFLEGELKVKEGQGKEGVTVVTSKLLQWYSGDFGATDVEKLQWLLPYLAPKVREQLKGKVSFEYRDYDWTGNGV